MTGNCSVSSEVGTRDDKSSSTLCFDLPVFQYILILFVCLFVSPTSVFSSLPSLIQCWLSFHNCSTTYDSEGIEVEWEKMKKKISKFLLLLVMSYDLRDF